MLGKTFYDDQSHPIRIVGVIEHMQGSWVGWDKVDRVMLTPSVGPEPIHAVHGPRASPARSTASWRPSKSRLRKRDPNRVGWTS